MLIALSDSEMPFEELSPNQTIDPSWVKSGHVEEASTVLYVSSDGKFIVQLWECRTAVELEVAAYPVDEFVTLVAGKVVITSDKGGSVEYSAGDSFLIPKGFVGRWSQAGRLRKYSVCYLG